MSMIQDILNQLGGRKFIAMTGATLMQGNGNTLIATKLKGSRKYNHLEVSLNGNDLYDVRFVKIAGPKRLFEILKDNTFNDVFVEDLVKLIKGETGLYLSL